MSENTSIDSNKLQQMIFIYNALEQGWVVKKKKDNIYEFNKERKHEEKDLSNFIEKRSSNKDNNNNNDEEASKFKWLEDYLRHFLELNSKMDIILANKN